MGLAEREGEDDRRPVFVKQIVFEGDEGRRNVGGFADVNFDIA